MDRKFQLFKETCELTFVPIQIARTVKEHMDLKYEPYWHVFLGKSFGCHAVHEKNRFVYFTFDHNKISFLIYKAS